MDVERNAGAAPDSVTRRRCLIGMAVAGLAAGSRAWGAPQAASGANQTLTSLKQEVDFKAAAAKIYEALLDSKQFAAFSGMAAMIDPKAGGAFSTFEGQIVGRTIELVPNRLIVQAWRAGDWAPGVYSIVSFELKPRGAETTLILVQKGFPEGEFNSLSSGWGEHYWEPLKKFLG